MKILSPARQPINWLVLLLCAVSVSASADEIMLGGFWVPNVTINTVAPGLFSTEALHTNLHAHARRGNTTYEAIVEDRISGCPAGRFADPSECGDLVAYICAAQSGFMSGQNIINDGGVYQGLF